MSVIIKCMEMPQSCGECGFVQKGSQEFCGLLLPEIKYSDNWSIRPDHCPLIELPPHGRLIDADALMETFRERKRPTLSDGEDGSKERVRYLDFISTLQAIKDAPTIIAAEEGE